MKAYVLNELKKDAQGTIQDVPMPAVGDFDVLVKVYAASINPLDLKIQHGDLKMLVPYHTPLILGNDMAGKVEQVGAKVTKFKVGDAVYSRPDKDRIGTFADYIAIHENDVALKPTNLSMLEAAAMPLVSLTAWQVLVEKGNLHAGQKVLIHAGSGGVGSVAIQLAKHLGAYVATTSSSKSADKLKSLGADEVIDYKTQDFSEILKDYDLILDTQGGETLEKSVKSLKQGGVIISLAGPPNPEFTKEFHANLIVKTASYLLSHKIRTEVRKKSASYTFIFMHADGQQLAHITQLIEQGKLVPVIDRVFDFKDIDQALAYVDKGQAKGKVVVEIATE